jgi:UDP-N-acetylmuramoyl-L-alanyl-D-glutamate--2,6-diaminopimelate ligase
LSLHRLDQCEFDVAVFTNLASDHLDFHGTMASYRDAKGTLFRMLDEPSDKGYGKTAVLNADDPVSAELARMTRAPAVTYGLGGGADLTGHDITRDGLGTRFRARMFGQEVAVRTPLLGDYNVSNSLAAVAASMALGLEFASAVEALATFPGVPGRMEVVDQGQKFRVVVDIASTEQAMRNVLSMLRPTTEGRLIVVFGAAGDRDPARRRGIARAVAAMADAAVITNEDPRGEPPDAILDSIEEGFRGAGFTSYEREMDRRLAIERAFAQARKGDTVLLAGKGTEPSIVMGDTHWPWDERRIARELLEDLLMD